MKFIPITPFYAECGGISFLSKTMISKKNIVKDLNQY